MNHEVHGHNFQARHKHRVKKSHHHSLGHRVSTHTGGRGRRSGYSFVCAGAPLSQQHTWLNDICTERLVLSISRKVSSFPWATSNSCHACRTENRGHRTTEGRTQHAAEQARPGRHAPHKRSTESDKRAGQDKKKARGRHTHPHTHTQNAPRRDARARKTKTRRTVYMYVEREETYF